MKLHMGLTIRPTVYTESSYEMGGHKNPMIRQQGVLLTWCGKKMSDEFRTYLAEEVTCKACMKTLQYQEEIGEIVSRRLLRSHG